MKSKILAFLFIFFCGCDFRYGLIESEFTLSTDSRLPKWIHVPFEYSRQDLAMKLTFYSNPYLSKAKMQVIGPAPEYKILSVSIGNKTYHPLTKNQPRDYYPRYILISVGEITEVFELKEMQPIIWITDNPSIVPKPGP